jgi:hypothetical protein
MKPVKTPTDSHAQFDAICAQLAEFDPLPPVVKLPTDREPTEDEQAEPLNGLILAGLVSP